MRSPPGYLSEESGKETSVSTVSLVAHRRQHLLPQRNIEGRNTLPAGINGCLWPILLVVGCHHVDCLVAPRLDGLMVRWLDGAASLLRTRWSLKAKRELRAEAKERMKPH